MSDVSRSLRSTLDNLPKHCVKARFGNTSCIWWKRRKHRGPFSIRQSARCGFSTPKPCTKTGWWCTFRFREGRSDFLEVLSIEEVSKLFANVRALKQRTILQAMYGAGLRLMEALSLQLTDIDSKRMVIRVRQGKGRKDRYVTLSPTLLETLREYYKACRPRRRCCFQTETATNRRIPPPFNEPAPGRLERPG